MKDCLKCKNLDTSDIPNLFCNISCELVNETEFRYCPKDIKSVIAFVEKQDKQIKELKQQLKAKSESYFNIFKQNDEMLSIIQKNTTKLQTYTEAWKQLKKYLEEEIERLDSTNTYIDMICLSVNRDVLEKFEELDPEGE